MFCKWCGKKITNNGSPCPSCGRNQDALENGNGFWDLCGKGIDDHPVGSDATVDIPAQASGKGDLPKENKTCQTPAKHKTAKGIWIGLWIATLCLLIITVIVMGIGIGKIEQCLTEISLLRSSISGVNTLVSDCLAEMAEYHSNNREVSETQVPVGTDTQNKAKDGVRISIDELLKNEDAILVESEKLRIESYEIDSTPAKCVYLAAGQLLANENAEFYWQKRNDLCDTWETMFEESSYIIVDPGETEIYRIICLVDDDTDGYIVYIAATMGFSSNIEQMDEDIVPSSTEDLDGTTDETESSATEPMTTDPSEDDTTTSYEGGGESVG